MINFEFFLFIFLRSRVKKRSLSLPHIQTSICYPENRANVNFLTPKLNVASFCLLVLLQVSSFITIPSFSRSLKIPSTPGNNQYLISAALWSRKSKQHFWPSMVLSIFQKFTTLSYRLLKVQKWFCKNSQNIVLMFINRPRHLFAIFGMRISIVPPSVVVAQIDKANKMR